MKNIAVLISGRGSNMLAIADAVESGQIDGRIALVLSNKPEAAGLEAARRRGYSALALPSAGLERGDYDRSVVRALQSAGAELVCLAGFMRLLSPLFVRAFPLKIVNIHPSLLPAFPGLHAQRQALEWGVKVTGCTVHFVDEELDHGPILLQQPVPVLEGDTEETLSDRILSYEHQIYPEAVRLICGSHYRVESRRVVLLEEPRLPTE